LTISDIILSKLPALNIQLPQEVHLLRICNDFVNIVLRALLPDSYLVTTEAIENLGGLAKALSYAEIGSEAWFKSVLDFSTGLFKGEPSQNQFICAFISRALAFASDEDYLAILALALGEIVIDIGLVAQGGLVINTLVCPYILLFIFRGIINN
jgi:hypothetical protein